MQGDVVGLEADLASGREARGDEILHDLVLRVDRDRTATGELGQRDAMPFPLELQVDAMVDEPFAVHPLADADGAEEIHGSLLEHACALSSLDVRTVSMLDHDRVDAGAMEQMAKRESGRSGADDGDLRASACVSRHAHEASGWRPLAVRGVRSRHRSSVSEARAPR